MGRSIAERSTAARKANATRRHTASAKLSKRAQHALASLYKLSHGELLSIVAHVRQHIAKLRHTLKEHKKK